MKLIAITALWCPSCLKTKQVLRAWIKLHPEIDLCILDLDLDAPEVDQYAPGSRLPVLIWQDDAGQERQRSVGERTGKQLEQIYEEMVD